MRVISAHCFDKWHLRRRTRVQSCSGWWEQDEGHRPPPVRNAEVSFQLSFWFTQGLQQIPFYLRTDPLSPPRCGVCASRLLSLDTWLQSACPCNNLVLIDNFNLFWERVLFFNRDGIHPNPRGSRARAANSFHQIWNVTFLTTDH